MGQQDLHDELFDIVNRMLEPFGKEVVVPDQPLGLGAPKYPFEITKPNEHDSKREFQIEYETLTKSIEAIDTLIDTLLEPSDDPSREEMRKRLAFDVNQRAKNNSHRSELDRSINLVRRNVADLGAYITSVYVVFDLQVLFRERLEELEQQKSNFWNLPHRPPDYFARVIALRLAKLFAQETGQRPTYGSSPDLGEPSTPYTRALRETFKALNISAQERGHAEWAISQIEERDLIPVHEGLLAALLRDDENFLTRAEVELATLTRSAKSPDR